MDRLRRIGASTDRVGISLLEVLISIGILSVGLLATLTLIPAGRSLIRKADIDNRSAALIPNAFSTMLSLGLFRVDSIDWQSNPPSGDPAPRDDGEQSANRTKTPVEPNGEPPSGKDQHFVVERWETPDAPPQLRGTAPAGKKVWVRQQQGSSAPSIIGEVTAEDGTWSITVPTLPSQNMQVSSESPWNPVPDTVFSAYTFSAYYEQENEMPDPNDPPNTITVIERVDIAPGQIQVIPPSAPPRLAGDATAAAYRHYHLRRKRDREVGDTTIPLYVSPNDRSNEEPRDAELLQFPPLGETVFQRRLAYVYKSRIRLNGEVWRWQIGTRRTRWDRELEYSYRNEYHTESPTINPVARVRGTPPDEFIFGYFRIDPDGNPVVGNDQDGNPGSFWVDGAGSQQQGPDDVIEDIDWYRINVEAGQTLELDWALTADTPIIDRSLAIAGQAGPFPVYFNAAGENEADMTASLLPPAESGGSRALYAIPGDGFVLTRVRLKAAKLDVDRNVDRSPGVQLPQPDDDYPNRINTGNINYTVDMTLYRNDRVVVIDPLMCARLDWIIDQGGGTPQHVLKRRRFADFQQVFAGTNTPKSFVIPRLNWRYVTMASLEQSIGLADWLCRPQDTLEIDNSANSDRPSLPRFDEWNPNPSTTIRARRQHRDRMSWLLMLQPEDSGPVPSNWKAGKHFHASIVAFEDRLLPTAPAPAGSQPAPVEGEHAFVGEWNFADGTIETVIPKSLEIADEDIQKAFRAGAWVLLAPRQALNVAPADDDTLLQWVEIQTADIKRLANSTVVRFIPGTEPYRNVLRTTSGRAPLIVLSYQGVTNVVTRAVRIQE
jgi:hypothetical protein